MEPGSSAPILSTPAEHIFEEPTPEAVHSPKVRLSDDELYVQYEIPRTIREIRDGRRRQLALQFPDEMLVDAPRVFELLRDGLKRERMISQRPSIGQSPGSEAAVNGIEKQDDVEERLCILGDTSYGACCVDEVAAEHVDADVVVHYGRACLSPTARLPVIYVFTTKPLDLDAAVESFKATYPDYGEKVCLMADIPYTCHVSTLHDRLEADGYTNLFATEVIHNPSSLLPNRTIPPPAHSDPSILRTYSIFHISNPPTSLLLILSSRIRALHIYPTTIMPSDSPRTTALTPATTTPLLRRRYATLTHLHTTPIFGILINTLSTTSYLSALSTIQAQLRAAGKKSYTFVVGKVNAAKLANFAEIGGWVVIGCWESSLLEAEGLWRPVITPFELGVALQGDAERVWDGSWEGGFAGVLGGGEERRDGDAENGHAEGRRSGGDGAENGDRDAGAGTGPATNGDGLATESWQDDCSDDEPPDFDLRTGQYISRTRPMGRSKAPQPSQNPTSPTSSSTITSAPAPPSSTLVQRPKTQDVTTINGAVSPAAEFLRSKRTWQGLGSEWRDVEYERDDEGKIRGAAMEEGRRGVAGGYVVGGEGGKR